ncbi:hypothetical protein ACFFGV_11920 [Pontibacillus salicampi]|uniref:Hsp20/alpha crystallin family protein n=1 Tax=Pontibacillus salicampi TaxID=1449801 RepID=A0ABV6LPE0_9BACI
MKDLFSLFSQFSKMGAPNQWNQGQLPNMTDMKSIDDYVKQTIQQALNGTDFFSTEQSEREDGVVESKSSKLHYEVIELHHYYIVKIDIPEGYDVDQLKLTLGNCKLYLSGIPNGGTQTITLPEQPFSKQYSAQYKDGVVEVRLLKKTSDSMKDIYIEY